MREQTVVTDEILESAKSSKGGYSKKQLALLGVDWPPKTGWKKAMLGKSLPSSTVAQFVAMSGR